MSGKLPGKGFGVGSGVLCLRNQQKAAVAGISLRGGSRGLRGAGVWGGCPGLWYRFGHLFHDSLILGLLPCTSSNISIEFPTHWLNGILSLWLFVICMVLFHLLLIIDYKLL